MIAILQIDSKLYAVVILAFRARLAAVAGSVGCGRT